MKRWMCAHCVLCGILCESDLHEMIDGLDPNNVKDLEKLNTLNDMLTATVETDNIIERLMKQGTEK